MYWRTYIVMPQTAAVEKLFFHSCGAALRTHRYLASYCRYLWANAMAMLP